VAEIFPEKPLTSLPAAVAAMGALPMTVGTEPRALSAERLMEIAARVQAATAGPWWTDTLAESDGSESVGVDAGDDNWIVPCQDLDPADAEFMAHARADVPDLLADNTRLRARIAELEAERRTTNEALDDAVREPRADRPVEEPSSGGYPPALPWLALLDEDDRTEFLDELADSATGYQSSDVRLAEVERTCATWRLIAEAQHGHNTAPGPDALTQSFAPVAALREDDPTDVQCSKCGDPVHWVSSTNSDGGFWRHRFVPGRILDHFGEVAGAEGCHAFDEEYLGEASAKRRLPNCKGCGRPASHPAHDGDVRPWVQHLRALLAAQRAALEDPHDSPLHSNYRLPHDLPDVPSLPTPPSCGLSADELDEVSRTAWFDGGA
jgi:hypothetical protein